MPILRINATPEGLKLSGSPRHAAPHLRALAEQPGPAIIMVHGYKYHPEHARRCPHRKLFGQAPHHWPARLGFDTHTEGEGLAIGLGWYARGSLKSVFARASALGEDIARIVLSLKTQRPSRPVHVIAHSLGAQAALTSLNTLPAHAIDRMVLLTGASYARHALNMLETPAGRTVEILNVTSRENDLFDVAFEHLVASEHANDRAIGHGIPAQNVANIQIDCVEALRGLRSLGFPVAPSARRICHWSGYRRSGVMTLYQAFLRRPGDLPLARLTRVLPDQTAPRWSRLFALPKRVLPTSDISLPLPAHRVGS